MRTYVSNYCQNMNTTTLVLGASINPERYAFKAVLALKNAGYNVVAVGLQKGEVAGVEINRDFPPFVHIDTVTLYIGKARQPEYYDAIVELKPRRVIFNPGTENAELEAILRKNNIETVHGCTLVMLVQGSIENVLYKLQTSKFV